ncbi:MAG: metal ABC transporter permease [Chloroflexi bacterium]|nr:metal ABC transporter permease [Chloroflexota bacterium]
MFNIFQYGFIQNAFIAGSIVAVVAALLGYFLIVRGLTFAGHALSNVGFAGAAGAVLAGIQPVYGLVIFTVAGSVIISILGKRIRERDVAVGVVMTFALGLGILFLSLYHGFAESAYSILFGSILGISQSDVIVTALFSLIIILGLGYLARPLMFSSFDPEAAEARGVPVRVLDIIFLILVALAISVAMQIVGVLIVFALLVGPAATANRLTPRPARAMGLAIVLGLIYIWLGIILAANTVFPVSFFVAALSFVVYLPVRLLSSHWWGRGFRGENVHA